MIKKASFEICGGTQAACEFFFCLFCLFRVKVSEKAWSTDHNGEDNLAANLRFDIPST